MGALLSLASALVYGIVDYGGGLLSRRAGASWVAIIGQAGGLVIVAMIAPFFPTSEVNWQDLLWGAVSGVGTGVGMLFLYRGMSRGAMSVVVPISAVGGVAIPVVASVILFHDRPSMLAWVGIVVALPALWMVSYTGAAGTADTTAATRDALFASVGIAVQYLALAGADAAAGLWPLVAGRLAATVALLPLLWTLRGKSIPGSAIWVLAACNGAGAAVALTCYMFATREDLVTIVVVLSSLYPVVPVILGITLLRERLRLTQSIGLIAAAVAVGLLTIG
jgi:uncharacterized membrane protein